MLFSAIKHEEGVREGVLVHERVAPLGGREHWLVPLQVLARYKVLGLATLKEHVLVQGQHHGVLDLGAQSVVTGDLWNEKLNPSVM